MADFMPTTMDNPWHPYKHPQEWLTFDLRNHYNTNSMVAAFNEASPYMDPDVQEYYTEQAVNKLLMLNPLGIHYKIYETDGYDLIKAMNKAYKEVVSDE